MPVAAEAPPAEAPPAEAAPTARSNRTRTRQHSRSQSAGVIVRLDNTFILRLLVVIVCLLAGAALDFFTSSSVLAYLLYLGAAALTAPLQRFPITLAITLLGTLGLLGGYFVHDVGAFPYDRLGALAILWLLALFTLRAGAADIASAEPATGRSDEPIEQERFRGVFDNAPMGTLLVNTGGTIEQVNPLCCEILGYSRDELVGRALDSLALTDERGEVHAMMAMLLEHPGDELRTEARMVRKDGREIWTTRHAALQRRDSGDPLHFIVQIADVTEMKLAAQQMVHDCCRCCCTLECVCCVLHIL